MGSFNYVEQGANRYVTGNIEAFDQKNEMFKRPFWDPQMKALGKKFYLVIWKSQVIKKSHSSVTVSVTALC